MFNDAFSAAQIAGYVAFVLGVVCMLQKDDRPFKIFMAAECLVYALHFFLLGNPTAVASSLVSLTRSVLSLYTRSIYIVLAIVAINISLGIVLVNKPTDALPLIASCIGTIALFLFEGIQMRVMVLVGTSLWLINNILVGSYGGTALETVILLVNSWTIWRMRHGRPALAQSPDQ